MRSAAHSRIEAEVRRLMKLPYAREYVPYEDGGYFARIVEFPGCMTEGKDFAEAAEMLDDAMASWIEARLEEGLPIPEPLTNTEYSGKLLVRMPKSLHRALSRHAESEGISLNQYIVAKLAQVVGPEHAYAYHPASTRGGVISPESFVSVETAAARARDLGYDAVAETREGLTTGRGFRYNQGRKRQMEVSPTMFAKGVSPQASRRPQR